MAKAAIDFGVNKPINPLDAFDVMMGGKASRAAVKGDIQKLSIDKLTDFPNQPFKLYPQQKLEEMAQSIQENGILSPILVRPFQDGYQIIAGHNRRNAALLAGLTEVPCIVKELDDDTAAFLVVDTNFNQREEMLPSEKAFAYKMQLGAIKRQGKRTDLFDDNAENDSNDGKTSRDLLAESSGESKNQISRYIRLTELIPELLELVDIKKLAFIPTVTISYLTPEEQQMLLRQIRSLEVFPGLAAAEKMKHFSEEGTLSEAVIELLLSEKPPSPVKVTLKQDKLKKYFGEDVSPSEIEEIIISLLEKWKGRGDN